MDNPTTLAPGDAGQATQKIQDVQATALAMSSEVFNLIQSILSGLKSLKSKDDPTKTDIEIQVGRDKVYKGTAASPVKNLLKPTQANVLNNLVNTPSTDLNTSDFASSVKALGGKSVTIRVNNEPVVRIKNGQLTNNLELAGREVVTEHNQQEGRELEGLFEKADEIIERNPDLYNLPEPALEESLLEADNRQIAADSPEAVIPVTPEKTEPGVELIGHQEVITESAAAPHVEADKANVEPTAHHEADAEPTTGHVEAGEAELTAHHEVNSEPTTPHVVPTSDRVEPSVEPVAHEAGSEPPNGSFKQVMASELALPDEAQPPKNSFAQFLSSDLAQSFKLTPETQTWLKETGEALKSRAREDLQKVSDFAGHVARSHQNRQIANTALSLLNSDPEGRIYRGEDFTVQAVNRHTISVSDREGQEILRFAESAIGPRILSDNLSPNQIKEFNQVRLQLERHGAEALLNSEAPARLSFLQGLSPQGDRAAVKHQQNLSALSQVENIFEQLQVTADASGRELISIGNYKLSRQGDNLEVTHPQRGTILARQDGTASGNLIGQDASVLRSMSQQLLNSHSHEEAKALPLAKTPQQTPQLELVD